MSRKNKKKIIAIGDIHGCCRSLEALIKKLDPYPDHTLLFIGDYIDRGPCSMEVVSYLIELKSQRECIFLRGNHEQMLLDSIEKGTSKVWMMNGGVTTLHSYGLDKDNFDLPEEHLEFYRETELYYMTDQYFFVHAGVPPHQTIGRSIKDENSRHEFLWGRDHLNAFETPWEKTVVFGHTPRPHPIRRDNMIGIDTGCVYSSLGYGKLTALVLPGETFVQQISLDND